MMNSENARDEFRKGNLYSCQKPIQIVSVYTILAMLIFFFGQVSSVSTYSNFQGAPGGGGRNGQGSMRLRSGYTLPALSEEDAEALLEAILEEYGALNLYQTAIVKVGNVYPFSQIVRSEQQHIDVLVQHATKYGLSVPANPCLKDQPTFTTLAQTCQAGVHAEIIDGVHYDTLKSISTHTDLLQVFNNLQSTSLNSHLPAFQGCD